MRFPVPLSVLDLSPVPEGATVGEALARSTDLARLADRLGFTRYWVAEHHGMAGVASTSPPVLLAHLGAATDRIRIGSGGVMLPNHAALTVAEQFGMLEALHPGRVDLGIGRAPGTDPLTARALRRSAMSTHDDFPEQLVELFGFFDGTLPPEHPYHSVLATTALGNRPAIWMLGSSDYGAHAAGVLGLPYSFAHHFASANTLLAAQEYRRSFRAVRDLDEPHLMIGVNVLCAPTDDEAEWLAGSGRLSVLRLRTGRPGRLPSPEAAAAHPYTSLEREQIRAWTASNVVGSPDTVRRRLEDLVEQTGANELIVTTSCFEHAHRLRSFELLAACTGLAPRADATLGAAGHAR